MSGGEAETNSTPKTQALPFKPPLQSAHGHVTAHPIPSNRWTLKKDPVKQKIKAGGSSLKVGVGAHPFSKSTNT